MRSSYYKFLFLSIVTTLLAQDFTQVTTGDVVTDGGDSRAVNWIDYDNDGDLDLFITNGPRDGQNNFFYENNGDLTFTKVVDIEIAQDNSASDGSTWGDVDNDGDLDLYVANWWGNSNKFYLNNGDKTFTEITGQNLNAANSYSETASWGDYNNDGYLDIYVNNSESNKRNMLFKNNGDNTFTKVSSGKAVSEAHYSRDIDWVDVNLDGLVDIYVTNEFGQDNSLYINKGDDEFEKLEDINIAQDSKNTWSSNWIDYDNDGDFDLFLSNWEDENNSLYQNNGDGTFTEITDQAIVNDGGYSSGSDWGDVDNDGDLDVYIGNAFAPDEADNFLYLNNGDGTFSKVENSSTQIGGWTYGVSFGDFDRDGYLDLALAKCFDASENNALFLNNGGNNNWVVINLEADAVVMQNNRSGIGSVIKVKANINGENVWQQRKVEGQNGYCGQNLETHFGLGDATKIDSVVVVWANGYIQNYEDVEMNKVNILKESIPTSINNDEEINNDYELFQNYPNPFNPTTTIKYSVPQGSQVRLIVYDILGNEVIELINGYTSSGTHRVEWRGENSAGKKVASGVYFYSLIAEDVKIVKKMFLIK